MILTLYNCRTIITIVCLFDDDDFLWSKTHKDFFFFFLNFVAVFCPGLASKLNCVTYLNLLLYTIKVSDSDY